MPRATTGPSRDPGGPRCVFWRAWVASVGGALDRLQGDTEMRRDLFDFWAEVPGDATQHPADIDTLARTKHGFDLRCLPSNVDGRLKTAPVVLLFVNPGMNDVDLQEAECHKAHEKYSQMRSGTRPLRGKDDPSRAFAWLEPLTRDFGSWSIVRDNVAVLNIAAYHSRAFKSPHMLAALPSCRVCLDWAQSVLFPQAVTGERIVICLRSAAYWGLRHPTDRRFGEGLFAPLTSRGGQMHRGDERDMIVCAVRKALARSRGC